METDKSITYYLNNYLDSFDTEKTNSKFVTNGLFGYMSHESVKYQEDINFSSKNVLNSKNVLTLCHPSSRQLDES